MKCAYCKKEFVPKVAHQKFCNDICRNRYHHQKSYEMYREQILAKQNAYRCKKKAEREAKERAQELLKKQLSEWISEAAECNLDYGTYRRLVEQGKTFEELKAQADNHGQRVHNHTPRGKKLAD